MECYKFSEYGDNFDSSLKLSFHWIKYSVSTLSVVQLSTIKVGSTLIRNSEGLPNIEDDSETVAEGAFRIVQKKNDEDESKEKSCIKIDNVPLRKLKSIVARKRKGKYRLTANRPTLKKKGKVL